ncbi:MAG: hypothetical protein KDK33_13555 [Leptospiraceae bacterium]|nr:hypothetical protein [Leptospiraceae bacterium]
MSYAIKPSRIRIMVLALLLAASANHCGNSSDSINVADYREFHLRAGKAICEKMQECYSPFIRTIRPEYQRKITVDACVQSMQKNLDAKLATHTKEIQSLSRLCYNQLLEADCKEFIVGTALMPACSALLEKSSQEYQKYPELMHLVNQKEE